MKSNAKQRHRAVVVGTHDSWLLPGDEEREDSRFWTGRPGDLDSGDGIALPVLLSEGWRVHQISPFAFPDVDDEEEVDSLQLVIVSSED